MKHSNFNAYTKSTNVRNSKMNVKLTRAGLRFGHWIFPKAIENFVREKFFTPYTKPLTKVQRKWINSATPFQVVSREKKIQLWKAGEGPSLLFVHGWNGRGVQFQRFFHPVLDSGYSVIFFDAPAHGNSDGERTNYLEVTASIKSIFDHEIGKDIVGIIGHSLGASAVINHLSRHPSEIPIVLVAPALRLMELLFTSFQLHGIPDQVSTKLVGEVEEEFQLPLETQNPIDLIKQLTNDILIIHDKKDKTTPIGPSAQIAKELENIELLETEGFGHNRLLKQKHIIDNAISFLHSMQSDVNDTDRMQLEKH